MYFSPLYTLIFVIGILISFGAELFIKFTYKKYKKVPTKKHIDGAWLFEWFVKKYNIPLKLNITNTALADHYDPRVEQVTLSVEVANNPSVASVAITAHELGHVLQKHTNYAFFNLRKALVPVTNFGTQLGYWLMFAGLAMQAFNLAFIGLLFFSFSFIFILVTLPVEFNASARAINMLRENNILEQDELKGAKKVLTAAALTYVAAMFNSLLNILYFAMRVLALGKRRD